MWALTKMQVRNDSFAAFDAVALTKREVLASPHP